MALGWCFLQAVAVLVAFSVVRRLGLAEQPGVSIPVLTGALALVACGPTPRPLTWG